MTQSHDSREGDTEEKINKQNIIKKIVRSSSVTADSWSGSQLADNNKKHQNDDAHAGDMTV